MTKYITEGVSVERTFVPTVKEVLSSPHLRLGAGVFYPPSNLQVINFVSNNGTIVTRYLYNLFHKIITNFFFLEIVKKTFFQLIHFFFFLPTVT